MTIEAGAYGAERRALDYVIAGVAGDGRHCDHGCTLTLAQIGRLCRDAAHVYYREEQANGLLRR